MTTVGFLIAFTLIGLLMLNAYIQSRNGSNINPEDRVNLVINKYNMVTDELEIYVYETEFFNDYTQNFIYAQILTENEINDFIDKFDIPLIKNPKFDSYSSRTEIVNIILHKDDVVPQVNFIQNILLENRVYD